MAEHDDVIPLSKPIVGRDGKMIDAIPVKKGQYLHVAILPFNYSKEIFGEDAHEYRPERWLEEDLTTKVKGFVAFAPILTFLGGPRCVQS
jgi:cytochrome P450